MDQDADVAQARELLHYLYAQVDEISNKLEAAEGKRLRAHGRTASFVRREAAGLRRELYEAHRLIDGLHHRFPATRPPRRWPAHPSRSSLAPRRPSR
ncbi:MAG: hypothetical protein JO280_02725 [Mycobacteriaceae bacterium]|nr:hypothetical protein [Mycobacteriaceae bacterium]